LPSRAELPGELDELRRLNGALAQLRAVRAYRSGSYQQERARLRGERAAEVRRLRHLPVRPWSHGELADALGVSRASIQQWERPGLDRRRT
jgi:DNA-binding transcriptional regulator YiaG